LRVVPVDQEAVAAQAVHGRDDDGCGHARCDRGVHRVAALAQRVDARGDGERVRRGNHAAARVNGRARLLERCFQRLVGRFGGSDGHVLVPFRSMRSSWSSLAEPATACRIRRPRTGTAEPSPRASFLEVATGVQFGAEGYRLLHGRTKTPGGQGVQVKVLRQAAPLALVIVLLLVSISTTFAQTPQGDNEAPVQVLIRARPGSDLERQLHGGRELQIRNSRRGGFHLLSPERGVASLSYPDMESALRALGELQRDPDVLIAELEQFRELYWEPVGETEYERQTDWVHQINLPEAWNITTGRDSVVVAVIDSGVSPTHPDLADKLVDGYNAPYKNDDWADIDGHGTHVAGIIGASGSNALGTVGVAMDVKIMPIRVVSDNGSISTAAIADSIYWAVDHGADVINLSLGATTPS